MITFEYLPSHSIYASKVNIWCSFDSQKYKQYQQNPVNLVFFLLVHPNWRKTVWCVEHKFDWLFCRGPSQTAYFCSTQESLSALEFCLLILFSLLRSSFHALIVCSIHFHKICFKGFFAGFLIFKFNLKPLYGYHAVARQLWLFDSFFRSCF